jgi:hypothetical protein
MNVYISSEKEMDQRLRLDKRSDLEAFCRRFDSEDDLPPGFFDLQDSIREGMEKILWANFEDGVDRTRFKSLQSGAMHTQFHVSAEMCASERIIVEICDQILGDKLIGLIWAYLEKCAAPYCVIGAVHRGLTGDSVYLGRFVMNQQEIVVEESLSDAWSRQIKFLEFEETGR